MDKYFEVLGPERFNRVMQRVFGSSTVTRVTEANHLECWTAMDKEVAEGAAEEQAAGKTAGKAMDLF